MPAAMLLYVVLDFFGLVDHRRKFRPLSFVKAVIADAENPKVGFKQRNHMQEVPLPMAAGAR